MYCIDEEHRAWRRHTIDAPCSCHPVRRRWGSHKPRGRVVLLGPQPASPLIVERQTPQIHCELCGASVSAEVAAARYCLDCELYVCLACWDASRSRCRACAPPSSSRRARGASLRTARRADRRLREAREEITALDAFAARLSAETFRTELACLNVKVAVAEQVGTRALKRLSGASATRARPLANRMRRHALAASAALGGAEAILALIEPRSAPIEITAVPTRDHRRWQPRFAPWAVALGLAVLFLALLAPGLLLSPDLDVGGDPSAGEDELAGHPAVTPPPRDRTAGPPSASRIPEPSESAEGSPKATRPPPGTGATAGSGTTEGTDGAGGGAGSPGGPGPTPGTGAAPGPRPATPPPGSTPPPPPGSTPPPPAPTP